MKRRRINFAVVGVLTAAVVGLSALRVYLRPFIWLPNHATAAAIEERYAEQIAELRELSVQYDELAWADHIMAARAGAEALFDRPEIVGASVWEQVSSTYRKGYPIKDSTQRTGGHTWFDRSATHSRSVTSYWRDGDREFIEYEARVCPRS